MFEADRQMVRRLAAEIADDIGWDRDWLNDGVKGFLSAADLDPEAKRFFATYPTDDEPGLRVTVANPRYLFAMKCRAMRIGGIVESPDVEDIRHLAQEIGIPGLRRSPGIPRPGLAWRRARNQNDTQVSPKPGYITSSEEALKLVAEFYPNNVLEPKVRFGLEEILGGALETHVNARGPEAGQS